MRMRITGLRLLLMTIMAVAAYADDWTRQWPVSGKVELRVDVDDGRVIIQGGESRQVEARVITSGYRIAPGEVTVTEHVNGANISLDVRVPQSSRWLNVNNRSIRVEVRVPRESSINVRTGDGSIHTEEVHGALRLKTGDGRIEAIAVEGSLQAETSDGSIRVRGRFDLLNLNTGDGSIEAEVNPGSKMTGSWDLHTSDGHVTLTLPDGFSAELNAHTNDGRVQVDLPVSSDNFDGSKGEFRGKLNNGGPALRIRTGDGGIRLARR